MKNEAFADTLEQCRRASELENCPQLLGGVARNAATTCTFLHDLRPQFDGQEIPALHMIDHWSCYVATLDNGTRSSLEIEWIKHANF